MWLNAMFYGGAATVIVGGIVIIGGILKNKPKLEIFGRVLFAIGAFSYALCFVLPPVVA